MVRRTIQPRESEVDRLVEAGEGDDYAEEAPRSSRALLSERAQEVLSILWERPSRKVRSSTQVPVWIDGMIQRIDRASTRLWVAAAASQLQ